MFDVWILYCCGDQRTVAFTKGVAPKTGLRERRPGRKNTFTVSVSLSICVVAAVEGGVWSGKGRNHGYNDCRSCTRRGAGSRLLANSRYVDTTQLHDTLRYHPSLSDIGCSGVRVSTECSVARDKRCVDSHF